MLLTLTLTQPPATDLGYLLYKHPDRAQQYPLSFGVAHVFYPEAGPTRCTVALLVDVDPIRLVRGAPQSRGGGLLDQYVNDRPYAAASFLSVAIGEVFSTALAGRCRDRPALATQPLPLIAHLPVTPARGGENLVPALFEPLGYTVAGERLPLDERFPAWGASPYVTLTLSATLTVQALLSHLYVLLPVLDNAKHYWVGQDELEKLLRQGADWLADHPAKEMITRRYLRHQWSLARKALARLEAAEDAPPATIADDADVADVAETDEATITQEEAVVETPLSLNRARIQAVMAELETAGVETVVNLSCGDGKLLARLLQERRFTRLADLEALERFVAREPLRRVHECVFGVLALESELVDPRL